TCRRAAATGILRTTTTNSAGHTVVTRSRARTKVHPASGCGAPICGMGRVWAPCRAVSDLPQGRRVAAPSGTARHHSGGTRSDEHQSPPPSCRLLAARRGPRGRAAHGRRHGIRPGIRPAGDRRRLAPCVERRRALQVVRDQRLFLTPKAREDATLFDTFRVADQYRPGVYRLAIDGSGRSFTLSTDKGVEVEHGAVGGAIGARLGFTWAPPAGTLPAG